MSDILSPAELRARLRSWNAVEDLSIVNTGVPVLVALSASATDAAVDGLAQPFAPVIGVAPATGAVSDGAVPGYVDVVVTDQQLDDLVERVVASPIAATTAVHLIRHQASATVADGLMAESLAYSSLQHGAQFEAWLATRGAARPRLESDPAPLLVTRAGARLTMMLNRPERRNAYSAAMRDALCEALTLVDLDRSIEQVRVQGAGKAFSAGGDLDEFGIARDAGLAHAVRMTRSAALLINDVAARLGPEFEFRLHGACVGAGIELPAFAQRVVARSDAFFQLPEVGFGLVPGAGGTVSITRRIGRLRTAWLALSNVRLSAPDALAWGLIDAIVEFG